MDKYLHDNVNGLNKNICEEIKKKLKEDSFKRYKILIHCIIGKLIIKLVEKKGQGIRIGSRCIWDTNHDSAVWASYENDHVYAFCAAFGVYFY